MYVDWHTDNKWQLTPYIILKKAEEWSSQTEIKENLKYIPLTLLLTVFLTMITPGDRGGMVGL